MDGCRHCTPCALERIESVLSRMETDMATYKQALQNISEQLTGLEEDMQRLIDAQGRMDPEAQAAADSIMARLQSMNDAADNAVPPARSGGNTDEEPSPGNEEPGEDDGDVTGGDPGTEPNPESEQPTNPEDFAPPAGEGVVVSPDADVNGEGGESDARPTA